MIYPNKKLTKEEFIERSVEKYGDKYDYNQSEYISTKSPLKIICKKHGEFYVSPANHWRGSGCQKCLSESVFWNQEKLDFIRENYETKGAKWISEQLGKSIGVIMTKACLIKVAKKSDKHDFIPSDNWCHLKTKAKKKNLEFSITKDFIYNLFLEQNKKCAISGIDILFSNRKNNENTASIDKINPNRGYTEDNVQIVHKIFNILKWDNNELDLIEMCEKAASHLKKRYSKIEWELDIINDMEVPIKVYGDKPILQKDMSYDGFDLLF